MFGKLDVELQKCAIRFSEKYKEDIQIWIKINWLEDILKLCILVWMLGKQPCLGSYKIDLCVLILDAKHTIEKLVVWNIQLHHLFLWTHSARYLKLNSKASQLERNTAFEILLEFSAKWSTLGFSEEIFHVKALDKKWTNGKADVRTL